MPKVAISEFVTDPAKHFLKENGYEIVEGSAVTKEDMINLVKDCDGLLIRIAPCDKDVLDAAKNLKVIAKHGVGFDNIDVEGATQKGIWVTATPTANANSVAEHALYLMFACAKNGYVLDKYLRETGEFKFKNQYIGCELEGKTLGLIGLGRIGQKIAQKVLHGIGMKVIGYDPFIKKENLIDGIELVASREEVFKRSDFISLHLPNTLETKGSIGMPEFQKMKRTAYLINTSRGEVVVEEDLIQALKTGVIKGAGIDVFAKEPPRKDNELLKLDNVVVSPHVGGGAKESLDRMGLHAAMGIHEVLVGQLPTWPVNKPKNI
ncbi:MAG: putative phosphoglycerate dehydrogenase [Clostridiales bacterium]|nr:putative phosphoglycerate dehydrogenase [Clostridiales bacterium]